MKLLFLLLLLIVSLSPSSSSSLDSDINSLLSFKAASDPLNSLSSWQPSTSSSSWLGVYCSPHTQRVTRLVLENLNLNGPTLHLLTNLTNLRVLSLKSNSISGHIPSSLSSLSSLRLLFLSHNNLSSTLPSSLSSLTRLTRLDLSFNSLSGPIPSSLFPNLTRLITLRLNNNHLTGSISTLLTIPPRLHDFNVSSNSLFGAVPTSLASFPASSFSANPRLCGPPLSSCKNLFSDPESPAVISSSPGSKPLVSPPLDDERRRGGSGGMSKVAVVAIVVGDFAALLLVSLLLFCYFWRKFAGRSPSRLQEGEKIVYSATAYPAAAAAAAGGGIAAAGGFEREKMVFFEGATKRFEVEDLLRASAEMLGKGAYGTTYKAVLDDGSAVAVKRLREVAITGNCRREFENQMELIGRLRHPNLVSLRSYYYAIDEKLLVYEFMSGGSLFSLLHGNRGPARTPLDWTTRIRIAAGAARGLGYIHGQSSKSSKVVHGNIRSSNILIDKSGTTKLADFGLCFLFPPPPRQQHGYRAPEAAIDGRRQFTQKGDVYALGVVMLEILTGKLVTDEVDLGRWVQSVVREEWTAEVFDLELMRYKGVEEEMVGLLQVAMACVATAPEQRPKVGQVLKMIEEIRSDNGSPSASYESFGDVDSSPCVSDETGTIGSQ